MGRANLRYLGLRRGMEQQTILEGFEMVSTEGCMLFIDPGLTSFSRVLVAASVVLFGGAGFQVQVDQNVAPSLPKQMTY